MKTVLVCHHDDDLNREALARWLASFSNLAGLVVIEETRQQKHRRIKREIQRVGRFRFLDVLAYRIYHRLRLRHIDLAYEHALIASIAARYPPLPCDLPIFVTPNANSAETQSFLDRLQPDLMIARCKVILKPAVFESARLGTYVMHPGICPKYRNAHGCFWALAEGDLQNVGMTLLKVDKGVDTGPVFGYFSYPYDELVESHIVIQHRVVFDNLDRIRDKFTEIENGTASTIDTRGHSSGTWGQPWLTKYFRWKAAAKRRAKKYETDIAALS